MTCDAYFNQIQFRNTVAAIIGEWGDAAQISRSHKRRRAVIKRRDFYAQTEETDADHPLCVEEGRRGMPATTLRFLIPSREGGRLQFGCINDLSSQLHTPLLARNSYAQPLIK